MSAVGAFFAAFVAAYLFTDWKDQAKYDSNKESCNMILEHISALRYNLSRKIDTINSIKSIGDFVVLKDELKVYKFEDDEKLHEFFKNRHHAISLKFNNKEIDETPFKLYSNISKHFIHISIPYSIIMFDYNKYQQIILDNIDLKKT